MIYQFITKNRPKQLSVRKACLFCSVSPSGYFKSLKTKDKDQKRRETEEKAVLAFHLHKGRYGYRKISHYLRSTKGFFLSPAQTRSILSKRGLRAGKHKVFRPLTTVSGSGCFPSVRRVFKAGEMKAEGLNQIWGSDITYLKATGGAFIYLAVFLDFYSRKIVGWELSSSLSSEVVLRAFYKALRTRTVRKGLIVHSDRGVQYMAEEFRNKLQQAGFVQSFSRKGNCYDNAYCESCFSLLKRELGHKVYGSMESARRDIFEWIEGWYNTRRLHSALGYKSPLEFEKMLQHGLKKSLNFGPLF